MKSTSTGSIFFLFVLNVQKGVITAAASHSEEVVGLITKEPLLPWTCSLQGLWLLPQSPVAFYFSHKDLNWQPIEAAAPPLAQGGHRGGEVWAE